MSEMEHSTHQRKRISNETIPECRNWENLNLDILAKIFSFVPLSDLCCNVSLVCHSWHICWLQTSFWKKNVLDLNAIHEILQSTIKRYNFNFIMYDYLAMILIRRIMEGDDGHGFPLELWRLSIRTVLIPMNHRISDNHLSYIAERTIGLENLVLLGAGMITARGFVNAISCWKNVKSIRLGDVKSQYFTPIIEEIGKYCSSLEILSLRMNDLHLTSNSAYLLANNLLQLKILRFEGVQLLSEGVKFFYTNPSPIEIIHFEDCFLMDEDPPESGQWRCLDLVCHSFSFIERKEDDQGQSLEDEDDYESFLLKWMNNEWD